MTGGRLGALAVTAAVVLLPLSPVHASGQPPVCQPDAVTVTIDSREAHLDLGANDVDPEGDQVVYAGTDRNIPGVGIVDNTKTGGPQDIVVFASTFPRPGDTSTVVPGTYQVKTFMNDGSNLAASTLTITVLPSPGDLVDVTRKKPGTVRVVNSNDVAVQFLWGAEGRKRADGRVDIPAHASRTIQIERRSLVTVVLAGSDYAVGIKRHLRPPTNGSALPPGVEHGHGVFEAYTVKWVRRAIAP